MKPLFVLLTVPHANCDKTINCDEIAKYMGNLLNDKLIDKNIKVKLFLAPVIRNVCDFNRYYCNKNYKFKSRNYRHNPKEKGFREKITNTILKFKNIYRILVLDIHSYNINKLKENRKVYNNLDAYFLDNYYGHHKSNKLAPSHLLKHCNEFLLKEGFKTKIDFGKIGFPYSYEGNDIMDEMNQRGLENFLIEFNENLSINRRVKIAESLVDWIKIFFKIDELNEITNKINKYINSNNSKIFLIKDLILINKLTIKDNYFVIIDNNKIRLYIEDRLKYKFDKQKFIDNINDDKRLLLYTFKPIYFK